MANLKRLVTKVKLATLCLFAPKKAGRMATLLFTESRNAANPQRQAFTPMGAKAIAVADPTSRVKQIYVWGEQGEIVLLVHGWGSECASMFGFVQKLLAQGFRVATFDGPAHGSSQGSHATMFEYVEATKMVIAQLGDVSRIIAHSLGGLVATAAASGDPKIKQLTLIATPFSLMDVLAIWSSGFMKLKQNILDEILAQLLKDNSVPVSHWDMGLHGKDWHVPVQVIHDTSDPIVNSRHASKIARILPMATAQLFDGLGHVKVLSSPAVHQAVVTFFADQPQPIHHAVG